MTIYAVLSAALIEGVLLVRTTSLIRSRTMRDESEAGSESISVRGPVAHTGIVGFKPTHGRVPLTGACSSVIDLLTNDLLFSSQRRYCLVQLESPTNCRCRN